MDTFIEGSGGQRLADGQNNRDLRVGLDARDQDAGLVTQLDTNPLKALKQNTDDERYRQIELHGALERARGTSGGGPRFNRTTRRVLLAVLLLIAVGAVAPFAWNYLQSYESTDDAQIDGHIDPLSSRINGTVVRSAPAQAAPTQVELPTLAAGLSDRRFREILADNNINDQTTKAPT